jgi:hypothetical protein
VGRQRGGSGRLAALPLLDLGARNILGDLDVELDQEFHLLGSPLGIAIDRA